MPQVGEEQVKIFASHFATFLGFAVLGWIVSWLNLSLMGVMFICALYSWAVTYEKSKRQKARRTAKFFSQEKEAIQELFEEIPRWVYFPDVERVEWLNKVAAKIWPDVTFYVRQFLTGDLEPKIQSSLPSKLKSFTFDRIDLGDMPPRVTGVKVYTQHTGENEIIIDVDVFYAGHAAVSIKISRFEAGVKDLQFKGTLRIVLKPLLKHPPFLGGIQIYFLTQPMLNFDLTDIASLLEVPGLYDLLNKVILTQISNYLVLPNMLSFSFSEKVDVKQLRYIEPKGILMMKLLAAKDLIGHDITSKSDPYAKISVSTEVFRTETVKNNHDPVWEDEVHYFTVLETDGINMELRMYDDDETSKDDRIGEVPIPLNSIVKAGSIKLWKKLSDDQGSVQFMCAWYSLTSEKVEPLPQAVRQSTSYHKPIPAAVLSVYVDRAKDLTPMDSGSEKDPSSYVKLLLGVNEKITGNILNTPNPTFQENFHFLVRNVDLEMLKIQICDAKSEDDVYGSVSIPLTRCLAAKEMTLDQPFPLTGGAGHSEILLRLSLKMLLMPGSETLDTAEVDDEVTSSTDNPIVVPIPTIGEEIIVPEIDTSVAQSAAPINNNNNEKTVAHDGMEIRKRKPDSITKPTIDTERKSSMVGTGDNEVGAIELTVGYKQSSSKLTVIVHRCRELNRAVDDEEAPSSYIKLQLSPSDRSHNKEKTDTIKDTFYPVFNETFEFSVEPYELTSKSLELKVKNYESFYSKVEIAAYSLTLANVNIGKPETKWYPLYKPDEKE